jgi:MFS family permease
VLALRVGFTYFHVVVIADDVCIAGSIIGGLFAALFALRSWEWTFYSFAITLVIITVVAQLVIPEPEKKIDLSGQTFKEKLMLLDVPVAIVGVTALVLINFAWNQAPIVGWEKAYVYMLLIIGILLVPLFFYIEVKSEAPLVPFHALKPEVAWVLACEACGWASFGEQYFFRDDHPRTVVG